MRSSSQTAIALLCGTLLSLGEYAHGIANGQKSHIRKYPYAVQLLNTPSNTLFCTGSLVSPRHVVTSGSCTFFRDTTNFYIVGGATMLRQGGVKRNVSAIYRPLAYDYVQSHMDVAVVKLVAPMQGNNIKPIAFCTTTLKPKDRVFFSGWGATEYSYNSNVAQLRTANAVVITNARCNELYKANVVTSSQGCTAKVLMQTCYSDGGSGMVRMGQLCGIALDGGACSENTKSMSRFTRISVVRQFIRNAMRN